MSNIFSKNKLLMVVMLMFCQLLYAKNPPSLGDPSFSYLSNKEAYKIGLQYYQKIKRSSSYIDDEIINDYVQNLTYKIASVAGFTNFNFKIAVLQSDVINAFALPGGFLVFNSALLQKCDNEAQFASVIAHEIAHITQNHHSRFFRKAAKNNFNTLAAILAAVVLANSNPDVAGAALYSGMAVNIQHSLNHSRAHEREADAVGIKLLAKAGINPDGMAQFFDKLPKQEDDNVYAGIGQYLSTHPNSENRIIASKTYIDTLTDISQTTDSLNFHIVKLKLTKKPNDYFFDKTPAKYQKTIKKIHNLLNNKKINDKYWQNNNNKYTKIVYLNKKADTDMTFVIKEYKKLFKIYPNNSIISNSYIKMLSSQKKYADIVQFYNKNKIFLTLSHSNTFKISEAFHKIGDKINSKFHLVDYYNKLGLYRTAKMHLSDLKNNYQLTKTQKNKVRILLDE
jgi:beta-barrel assembly-enhancing protease